METTLDFYLLTNTEPDKLVIIDASNYLEAPDTPILSITFPGFKKPISISYTPNTVTTLNTSVLGQSQLGTFSEFSDGVYNITLSICPNDQMFKEKFFLVDTNFKRIYYDKFMQYMNKGRENKQTENNFNEIDNLIEAARISAFRNNPITASFYYNKALYLVNKLNCMN